MCTRSARMVSRRWRLRQRRPAARPSASRSGTPGGCSSPRPPEEIGRASWRGKGEISGGGGSFKKKKVDLLDVCWVCLETSSGPPPLTRAPAVGPVAGAPAGVLSAMAGAAALAVLASLPVRTGGVGGYTERAVTRAVATGRRAPQAARGSWPAVRAAVRPGAGASLRGRATGQPADCGAYFVFFFQAEDGIRDLTVTGVQTCALPI